jgi:hypothetical protein
MRLERKAAQLKELAMVRGLQRLQAEAAAMRAASMLDERNTQLKAAERQCDADSQAWQETMSADSVRTELAGLWSQVLLRSETGLRSAKSNAVAAETERDRRSAAYHAATMRRDVMDGLARKARDAYARGKDEQILQDVLDAHKSKERRGR